MHLHAEINPDQMQFNDIKIGDKIAIEMSAFNWIELATEIHAKWRDGESSPAVVNLLMSQIFHAMTPEDYRKSLLAEYAEAQEMAQNNHPLAQMFRGGAWSPMRPEDVFNHDENDDE